MTALAGHRRVHRRARHRPACSGPHQRKALKNDLWLYVQDLHKVTEAYRAEFADLVNGYLDHVCRRVLRSLPAPHKLAYHLVRIRAMPQLAELAAWLHGAAGAPGAHGPALGQAPRRPAVPDGSPVPIPARVFRPHWRDLDPYMQVDESAGPVAKGGRGPAGRDRPGQRAVGRYPPAQEHVQDRDPAAGPAGGCRSCCPPARSSTRRRPRCPSRTGTTTTGRGSGSRSAPLVPVAGRGTGDWQCFMLVRGHGVWRPARVHTPVPGPAERPQPRLVAPGLRFGARWVGLGLNVARWRLGAVVAALAWHDADAGTAEIEVEMLDGRAGSGPGRPGRPGRAGAGAQPGGGGPVGPGCRGGDRRPAGRPRFRALVPLSDLAGAADVVDRRRPGGRR